MQTHQYLAIGHYDPLNALQLHLANGQKGYLISTFLTDCIDDIDETALSDSTCILEVAFLNIDFDALQPKLLRTGYLVPSQEVLDDPERLKACGYELHPYRNHFHPYFEKDAMGYEGIAYELADGSVLMSFVECNALTKDAIQPTPMHQLILQTLRTLPDEDRYGKAVSKEAANDSFENWLSGLIEAISIQ